MKTLITGTFAALTLFVASPLLAADADENATAITIWVDGKGQGSMAEEVTEKHAEMAEQGWRFQGLDVYTEDGDMKGMFVSYVREPAPAAAP